jgi:hypothetical protein
MSWGMKGPIAVIVERLGPYHLARLQALGKAHPTATIQLVAQESTYQWEQLPVDEILECRTIFHEESEYKAVQPNKLRQTLGRVLGQLHPSAVAISGWSEPWALEALRWCSLSNVPAILMSDSQEIDCARHWAKEMLKKRIIRLFSGALVGGKPHTRYAVKLGMDPICVRQGYDVVDNEYFKTGADMVGSRESYWREQLILPEKYFLACSRLVKKKILHV